MRLQLSVWAESVPAGKHPFAVLTQLSSQGTSTLLGQTEVLANSIHPDWTKLFYLDNITLSETTHVVVTLFSQKESLGAAVFDVQAVLGTNGGTQAKQLKNQSTRLFLHVTPSTASAGILHFQFRATDLPNVEGMGLFNKSDPFFELQRWRSSDHYDAVFRSAAINNNLQPVWLPGCVEIDALCGDDYQQFRIVVYDHNNDGEHVIMGSAVLTLPQLLTKADIGLQQAGRPAGKIIVMAAHVEGATQAPPQPASPPAFGQALDPPPVEADIAVIAVAASAMPKQPREPTFANYISGGCQLRMMVAIDVTASNGDPKQTTSLHHFDDAGKNAYETAIFALGSMIAKFDSDQKFPVYGFGAKVHGALSHCFPIHTEAEGIPGILEAYRNTFRQGLAMSSPRDFSHVIQHAATESRNVPVRK
jgi:hypothetical protein